MEREVAPERTGWRDESLSIRHRAWGFDCPAVDVDFLLIEYASGKAKAIVDYKRASRYNVHADHPSIRAMLSLCEWHEPPLPCWVACYTRDPWRFKVEPLNEKAVDLFGLNPRWMTEREYVANLYLLRYGRISPEAKQILAGLNDEATP